MAALTAWSALAAATKTSVQNFMLLCKGQGTDTVYAVEVDQTTGLIPVSAVVSFSSDYNYGVVGANTLRTASQIGNATGAAAFGTGARSAQTLRVTVATDDSVPVTGTFWQATQPVSGTVAATQSGTWNITNVSGTVSLPTGASTEATLAAASAKLPATLGQKAMAASMAVTLASDQSSIPVSSTPVVAFNTGTVGATSQQVVQAGRVMADKSSLAVSSITAAAYTQLIASTAAICSLIDVTNTTGEPMIIAVGGAGAEVDRFYVGPAGSVLMPITIAASSRISAKSLGSTATSGYLRAVPK